MHQLQTFPVVNDDKILQIFLPRTVWFYKSSTTDKQTNVDEYTTRG